MPHKTTVLGGSINIGDVGIRVVGILWLAVALAFAVCGIGILARQPWSLMLTISVIIFSLILCVIGWPDSRIGIFVNVVLLVVMLGAAQ
jgi:hypothetical protein